MSESMKLHEAIDLAEKAYQQTPRHHSNRIIGKHAPTFGELVSINRGTKVIEAMALANIWVSVIVQEGVVLGANVFEVEGTQSLIERCKDKNLRRGEEKPILVFGEKHPPVSSETIHQLIEAKMRGIAMQTDISQIVDLENMREIADRNSIFIVNLVED